MPSLELLKLWYIQMFIAGRPVVGGSPFLQGWQQEYMKAHGSMPSKEKVFEFLLSVANNNSIPMQNKQSELRMLDQMQRFAPETRSVIQN